MSLKSAFLLFVAAAAPSPLWAKRAPDSNSDHLLGDWGGLRSSLDDAGIHVEATYLGEAAADVAGGKKRGIAYAGEAAAKITLDMDKIAGAKGLSLHIGLLNRHGKNASALYVGDSLFHAQEIYGAGGGVAVHLAQLYLEQKLSDGDVDLKAGRLPVMTDFGVPPHGCDFVSLTICANRGLNANLGWTAWPRATWGASVTGKVSDTVKLKTGLYEVNRHTGGPWGLHWSLDGGRGVMIPAEVDWTPKIGGMPGTYKLGASLDTARFSEWNTAINGKPLYATEAPAERTTRYSAYLLGEQQVSGDPKSGRGLTVIGGYTWNSPSHALFRHYAFLGAIAKGPFQSRPDDEAGIQVSYGRVPPQLSRRQRADIALGLPIANGAPGVQNSRRGARSLLQLLRRPRRAPGPGRTIYPPPRRHRRLSRRSRPRLPLQGHPLAHRGQSEVSGEVVHEAAVKVALEFDDKSGEIARLNPFPVAKLRVLGVEVHVVVAAQEPRQEPVLHLALPLSPPQLFAPFAGKVVTKPLGVFGDFLDQCRRDSRLFLQLAKRSGPRFFTVVDPALWHLPGILGVIDPRGDEDLAVAVEEHDSSADAVQVVVVRVRQISPIRFNSRLEICSRLSTLLM